MHLYCIILSLSHEQQSCSALQVYHPHLRFVSKKATFLVHLKFNSRPTFFRTHCFFSMLRFAHGWRGCCALLSLALPGCTTSLFRWSQGQQCRALRGVALVRGPEIPEGLGNTRRACYGQKMRHFHSGWRFWIPREWPFWWVILDDVRMICPLFIGENHVFKVLRPQKR